MNYGLSYVARWHVCVCVCVRVRACVRACVRVCVCALIILLSLRHYLVSSSSAASIAKGMSATFMFVWFTVNQFSCPDRAVALSLSLSL